MNKKENTPKKNVRKKQGFGPLVETEKSAKLQQFIAKTEQQQTGQQQQQHQPQQNTTNAEKPKLLVTQFERQQQQLNYARQQELFQQQQLELQKRKAKLLPATPPKNTPAADSKTSANLDTNQKNNISKVSVAEKLHCDVNAKSGQNSTKVQEGKQAITLTSNHSANAKISLPQKAVDDVSASQRQGSKTMPAASFTQTHKADQDQNTLQENNLAFLKASTQTLQSSKFLAGIGQTQAKSAVTSVQSSTEKQTSKPEHTQELPRKDQSFSPNQSTHSTSKAAVGSHDLHKNVQTSEDLRGPVIPYYQNLPSSTLTALQNNTNGTSNQKAVCASHGDIEKSTPESKQTGKDSQQESVKQLEESIVAGSLPFRGSPPEQGHLTDNCSTPEDGKEDDLYSLSHTSSESEDLLAYEAIVAPTKFLSNLRRKVGNFFFGKKTSTKDVEAGEDPARKRKHPKKETSSPGSTNECTNETSHQRADADSPPIPSSVCNSTPLTSQQACPLSSQHYYAHTVHQVPADQRPRMQTGITSQPAINQQSTATPHSKPTPNGQNFVTQPTTITQPTTTQSSPAQLQYALHPPSLPTPQLVPTSQIRASAPQPVAPTTNSVPQSQKAVPSANSAQQSQQAVPTTKSNQQSQQVAPTAKSAQHSQPVVPTTKSAPQSQQGAPTTNSAQQSQQAVPTAKSAQHSQPVAPTAKSAQQSQQVAPTAKSAQHSQQVAPTAKSAQQSQPAPTAKSFQQSQQVAPTTNMIPQPHGASQTAVRQTNTVNSASQIQGANKSAIHQPSAVQQNKNVPSLLPVPIQTSVATKLTPKSPPSVVVQQKAVHQGNSTTAQTSVCTPQTIPQAQHKLPTTTSQLLHTTANSEGKLAQSNKATPSTGQPKTATPQPVQGAAQCKVASSQSNAAGRTTQSRPSTMQEVAPSTARASPQVKDERKTNAVALQVQQTSTKTQSSASNQGKTSADTQQIQPSSQPNHAATTNTVSQSKNVAPQENLGKKQQSHKAASDTKGGIIEKKEKEVSSASPQAAKKEKNNEAESTTQPGSVAKSPLASQTITKDVSQASSESKKEMQLKSSPLRQVLKPRRRLTYQEKVNGNANVSTPSSAKKPTVCGNNKTPEKLEIVKPEDIEVAVAIALDQVHYTPTRKVKIMPQIPPPQIDDNDDDAPEPCEQMFFTTKRKTKGGKGRYGKNVNSRKSVNCCCEDSCGSCTTAEDWDGIQASHNRRKR